MYKHFVGLCHLSTLSAMTDIVPLWSQGLCVPFFSLFIFFYKPIIFCSDQLPLFPLPPHPSSMPAQCGGTVNSTLSPTEPDCQEADIECPGVAKSVSSY